MDAPSPTVTAPPPRPVPPGPTGPATMRPQSGGMKEAGYPFVALGLKFLEMGLGHFGSTTPEGLAIVTALKSLAPKFGQPTGDLTKQSMKLAASRVNPMGTPGPDNAAAMQEAMRQKLKMGGVGGAAPAPAPAAAPDAAA